MEIRHSVSCILTGRHLHLYLELSTCELITHDDVNASCKQAHTSTSTSSCTVSQLRGNHPAVNKPAARSDSTQMSGLKMWKQRAPEWIKKKNVHDKWSKSKLVAAQRRLSLDPPVLPQKQIRGIRFPCKNITSVIHVFLLSAIVPQQAKRRLDGTQWSQWERFSR